MSIYTIYKATNKVNGKSYIGFDSNYPNRISQHKDRYKTGKTKFYLAIQKYGWDNFEWEVIYQSEDGNYCLCVMEAHYIKEHDTFFHGYNSTLGGEGVIGYKHTTERKYKISEKARQLRAMFGKHLDQKTLKESHSAKGSKLSSEHRKEISKSLQGHTPGTRVLKQIDHLQIAKKFT